MCCTVGELGSACMMAGSSKDSTRGSSSCNMETWDKQHERVYKENKEKLKKKRAYKKTALKDS